MEEFDKLTTSLERGYKYNYSKLLNIVCFLETYKDLNNSNYIMDTLLHE